MDTHPLLQGVLIAAQSLGLPVLIALVVYFLTRPLAAGMRLTLALLLGFSAGWAALFGSQASFPPRQTLDWLPLLAAVLAVLGVLPRTVRCIAAGLLLAIGLWLFAPPLLLRADWLTLLGEWGVALVLGLALLVTATQQTATLRLLAALAAAFEALGFVTSLGGSIVIGSLLNVGFALAGLLWLVQSRLPATAVTAAGAAGAVVWVWLAFSARHLAEIHPEETLLAAAALLTLWLPLPARWQRLTGVLLPAVPALLAIGLAVWRYFAAQSSSYY